MFFPYKDDNPQILIPYVTYWILGLNLLVFFIITCLQAPWPNTLLLSASD